MVFWKNTVISYEKKEKKQKFSWKILLLERRERWNFVRDVLEEDFFEILSEKRDICGKNLFDKWTVEAYNYIIEEIRLK